jgi:hypothetical protein
MLSPLKQVMVEYKSLIVKCILTMIKANLLVTIWNLLWDYELILGLPCLMPMLKVVHTFIMYVQCRDDFIMNFVDVVNLGKVELFCLYTNSLSKVMIICSMTSQRLLNFPMMFCFYIGVQILLRFTNV